MYWSEKYQLGILDHYLRERDVDYATEARLYSIPVDIVGLDGCSTISIELKTKDFKRGIRQAERNTSFVNYSYLSVWEEYVTDSLVERVSDNDIGLLSVGECVKCLSQPNDNNPSRHATDKVRERVKQDVREYATL